MTQRYDNATRILIDAAIDEARRVKDQQVDPLHMVVAAASKPVLAPVVAAVMAEKGLTASACRAFLESVADGVDVDRLRLGRGIATVVGHSAALARKWNTEQVTGDLMVWAALTVKAPTVDNLLLWAKVERSELETLIAARFTNGATRDDTPFDQDNEPLRTPVSGRMRGRKHRPDPLLAFGVDLVAEASAGHIDPYIGRLDEIDRLHAVLLRRTKNNPLLLGEPGVGKTALAEALASQIAAGSAPEALKSHRVILLDVAGMLAGARLRGDFEERVKHLTAAIASSTEPVILFIDEVHTILRAGAAAGSLALGNMLKGALARREVTVIGATTLDEFRQTFSKDEALARRFQPIVLDPPSVPEAIKICMGLRSLYEQHHGVRFSAEAIETAVRLADRLFVDRQLPDKALDVIDETAAAVAFERMALSGRARLLADRLATLRRSDDGVAGEVELIAAAVAEGFGPDVTGEVTPERVRVVIARMVGVPVETVSVDEAHRFADLPAMLSSRVFGHDAAMREIAGLVRQRLAGLGSTDRPVSILLAGPSGVGKTETARALADALYGADSTRLVQIDGSEYQEANTMSRLVGAPPGYIGHGEAGLLTEPLRRNKSVVLLLDEFDKVHPQIADLLLQLLEEGRLTDGSGRSVDASGAIVVVTVNRESTPSRPAGFVNSSPVHKTAVVDLAGRFRPELLNRFDAIIGLDDLATETLVRIARVFVAAVESRLLGRDMSLTMSDAAFETLVAAASVEHAGARPLRRLVREWVEDPAAELLMHGDVGPGDQIMFEPYDGALRPIVLHPVVV